MLKQTHYITLCYSSLCIGFGWQRAKITTTVIVSNILRHTHTHKRWKLNQGIKLLSALFTRLCKKIQHFRAKIQRIFPFFSSAAIIYFHVDLIEGPEQKGLQLWHSDLSVQPTNQRWMSRGLLQPFRTGNAELLFLVRTHQLNWPVTGRAGLWIIPCQNNLFYYHLRDVLFWKTTGFSSSYLPTATWWIK